MSWLWRPGTDPAPARVRPDGSTSRLSIPRFVTGPAAQSKGVWTHCLRVPPLGPCCLCSGVLQCSGSLPPLEAPLGTHPHPYSQAPQLLMCGFQKRRLGPGWGCDLPRVT